MGMMTEYYHFIFTTLVRTFGSWHGSGWGSLRTRSALGGGGDSCYRIFRLDLFPKAVGVTPEKGTICLCGPPTLRRGIVL